MEEVLSPDLFLFQRICIDILDYCKKNIKAPPFDDMNVEQLVKNNRKQQIDIYHKYFLHGLANNKTRQYVCKKYDQLIRDNLINKDYLPPSMITSIINYRPNIGSTASSGSGSVGSNFGQQMNIQRSLHVGKLISTIICSTIQPSFEINTGLNFILQGTRNKTYGSFFYSLLEQIYLSLSKFRHKPTTRFSEFFINHILNEVQYHQEIYPELLKKYAGDFNSEEYTYQYIDRSEKQVQKKLCIHTIPSKLLADRNFPNIQQAKFGKCFICERDANNYDKILFVPLCSMQCKNKLKNLSQECLLNDHFSFFDWLLDTLVSQQNCDEIVYSLFLRELVYNQLSKKNIYMVMEIIANNISLSNTILLGPTCVKQNNIQNLLMQIPINNIRIIQHSISIFTELFKMYSELLLIEFFHQSKIVFYEIIRFMELLPVTNSSIQLNILKLVFQILQIETPSGALVIKQLYIHTDCRIFQHSLIERMFNILSQYAVHTYTLISGANLAGVGSSINTTNSLKQESTTNLSMSNFGSSSNIQSSAPIVSGGDGNQCAINVIDKLLTKLYKSLAQFENQISFKAKNGDKKEEAGTWQHIYNQKMLKEHLKTVFTPQFNKKPVKYIQRMQKQLPFSSEAVALYFLINLDYQSKLKKPHEFISKKSLGELFGSPREFPQLLYKNFLSFLEPQYQSLQIDDCLRITFNTFSLPKEAQQIQTIFSELSLILQPYLSLEVGEKGTATYQWIMAVLMVQTSTQPSVKQKLILQDFKGICSRIKGGVSQSRVIQVYSKINKRPLENLMKWQGKQVFTKKYISSEIIESFQFQVGEAGGWQWERNSKIKEASQLQKSTLSASVLSVSVPQIETVSQKQQIKMERRQQSDEIVQQKKQQQAMQESIVIQQQNTQLQNLQSSFKKQTSQNLIEESRIQIAIQKVPNPLSAFLLSIWQFLYVSLVNNNNLTGLQNTCAFYGRCGLKSEFQTFFNNIYRIYKDSTQKSQPKSNLSARAVLILLHSGIQHGNYILGISSWFHIIKIIYRLDEDENFRESIRKNTDSSYYSYLYDSSDKLFTHSKKLNPKRLKQFIDAMCEFSSSEFKTQKKYTRQVYILQHMTQIIQYNLQRLPSSQLQNNSLFYILWPTIKSYFHAISMHPRRQISLAAIDAYKQLTMKILKISFNTLEETQEVHEKLLSVYQYVFQRSPSDIRDFIINVLLNVVSKDMKAGWEQLFNVLDGSDCGDKSVIIRIIGRLRGQLGYERIGSLRHLHGILIKQLMMSETVQIAHRNNHYQIILGYLWQITEFLNDQELWMETLSISKDIFKSSNNNMVLDFFYRLCNYIWNTENSRESNTNRKAEIYKQILDVQIHILQEKNQTKFQNALYLFFVLQKELVAENLGSEVTTIIRNKKRRKSSTSVKAENQGSKEMKNEGIGYLSLWEMFITNSHHPLIFCAFLGDYLGEFFGYLKNSLETASKKESLQQCKLVVLYWIYKLFTSYETNQILSLSNQDEQLNLGFKEAFKKTKYGIQNNRHSKIQLIEFSLSSKDYTTKCAEHLIYLNIFKKYAQFFITQNSEHGDMSLKVVAYNEQTRNLQSDFLAAILDSYSTACKINDRPLLRNFLWQNEFLNSTVTQTYLPGLLKQELHTYDVLSHHGLNWCKLEGPNSGIQCKITELLVGSLGRFHQKMEIYLQKEEKFAKNLQKKVQEKDPSTSQKLIKDLFYQDLGLWLSNIEPLVSRCLCTLQNQFAISSRISKLYDSHFEEIMNSCVLISYGIISKKTVEALALMIQRMAQKLY